MAPVEFEYEPRYLPLALAVLRVATATYASYTVGRSLYRSHKALGPAQDTRQRSAERAKLTIAFGSLAALGLAFAVTSGLEYLTLSYKVWASERGIQVPESFFGQFGKRPVSTNGTHQVELHLRHWLSDTSVYRDALEIVAEETRRLWWGEQVDLATISWTTLLAIEGRRRRIPHLWAYALLPHLVSLSFAQNLFYVALIQTPSPIPSQETRIARVLHRMLPKKPNNWFPNLSLLMVPLTLNYMLTLWLPSTAGTASFPTAVLLSKLLILTPLVLPATAPASWGTVHSDPRDAYPAITKVFNTISAVSAILHAKTTAFALLYNLPDPHKYSHGIKLPLDFDKRSKWERTATAVEKVLGSITDHPAVAAAGKDALLCALSLGLWAAVRSSDLTNMLRSLFFSTFKSSQDTSRGGTKSEQSVQQKQEEEEEESTLAAGRTRTIRRRGWPVRTAVYTETVKDEVAQPTPKRRGRPRKVKPEPEPEPESVSEQEEAFEDAAYEPTPAVRADVELGDILPDDDFDWEPAALAWGLTALGGLGVGSAAVFGAECISR